MAEAVPARCRLVASRVLRSFVAKKVSEEAAVAGVMPRPYQAIEIMKRPGAVRVGQSSPATPTPPAGSPT